MRNHTSKQSLRLTVQLCFTALSNGYAVGFAKGKIFQGNTKALCLPGLNCYSCPGALGSCPIGSLQAVLSSPEHRFSFYVVGFLLVFGALSGRFICGWLCPFGLVQDLLYKIPFIKKIKNLPGHKVLIWLKYLILLGFVILLPIFAVDIIGQGSPWFCKYICPSGTLFGALPLAAQNTGIRSALGALFTWKMTILVVLLSLSAAVYRPFCKYLCPLGAIYGACNPVSLYKYRVEAQLCTGCKACQSACPADIPVYKKPNSPECIRCGKCKSACPHKAILSSLENGHQKKKGTVA